MIRLTRAQIVDLRWMRELNDEYGTSLYWSTIKKTGPVPECTALVEAGLAELRSRASHKECRGYWITDEGRAALTSQDGGNA